MKKIIFGILVLLIFSHVQARPSAKWKSPISTEHKEMLKKARKSARQASLTNEGVPTRDQRVDSGAKKITPDKSKRGKRQSDDVVKANHSQRSNEVGESTRQLGLRHLKRKRHRAKANAQWGDGTVLTTRFQLCQESLPLQREIRFKIKVS